MHHVLEVQERAQHFDLARQQRSFHDPPQKVIVRRQCLNTHAHGDIRHVRQLSCCCTGIHRYMQIGAHAIPSRMHSACPFVAVDSEHK